MQVNSNQQPRPNQAGRSEAELRERLKRTMDTFFDSDALLGSALNFRWEGDGMEQVQNVTVAGGVEVGSDARRVHGHFVVRLLHTTNLGFANTHQPYGKKTRRAAAMRPGAPNDGVNPGYRPEGEPLVGDILASVWNQLDPPYDPPVRSFNVLLYRLPDPRSALEYATKDLPPADRAAALLQYELVQGAEIAHRRAQLTV